MAEPYHGDVMLQCPLKPWDFKHCCAVVVSGDGINFCGHTLLHTGGDWYFHVAGVNDVPKFMRESGYQRYLKENGKHEIRRWIVKLPNPAGAHAKLEELLTKQWLWLVLPHNCANFVEEVVRAGGSKAGMYFNCPTVEPFVP
jgi:hypothetical protein